MWSFDFEAAQRELTRAVPIVGDGFFLNEFRDEFLDNAWYLMNEVYCRIHQKIDIGCVSNMLSVSLSDSSGTQPHLHSTFLVMRAKSGSWISSVKLAWEPIQN